MCRVIAILLMLFVLVPAQGSTSSTMLYRWIDDTGAVHFTQGLENVPNAFRGRATPLGDVEEPPPSPPSAAPAPPPVPTVQTPSASKAPPPPGAPERNIVDDLLETAQTSLQYVAAAQGYARLRLPLGAKTALQKAAEKAATAADWNAIADCYDLIGETKLGSEARQRARRLAEWDRRFFGR